MDVTRGLASRLGAQQVEVSRGAPSLSCVSGGSGGRVGWRQGKGPLVSPAIGEARQPQLHPGAAVVHPSCLVPCYPQLSSTPIHMCCSLVRRGPTQYSGINRADCTQVWTGGHPTTHYLSLFQDPCFTTDALQARSNLLCDELRRHRVSHGYGLVKGGERRPPLAMRCIFLYASFFGTGGLPLRRAGAGLHPCRVASTWGEELVGV